jgi:ubiquinone/menaquinone biosynthesis C-methylase UbiE
MYTRRSAIKVLLGTAAAALAAPAIARSQETNREEWQRVPDVLAALAVAPGAVIADLGAGDGFFTVRLARAVGNAGRVYAVDISTRSIDVLNGRKRRENLQNVEVVEAEPDDPKLPNASLDAVLIVNAYHEMTEYAAVLAHVKRALKPTGRFVIVEPFSAKLRTASREAQTRAHTIAPDIVRGELEAAGFVVTKLEEEFARHAHGHDENRWEALIVATPGPDHSMR